MGIPSDRIFAVVMGISAALAAAAGVLAGPFLTVQPTMWLLPIVKAFAIVVVGGLGSIPGSILAALMLGYAETIVGYTISTSWTEIVSVLATLADAGVPAGGHLRAARRLLTADVQQAGRPRRCAGLCCPDGGAAAGVRRATT